MPYYITTETPLQGDGMDRHEAAVQAIEDAIRDEFQYANRRIAEAVYDAAVEAGMTPPEDDGEPCEFCGMARSRCEKAPERFGTERCCDRCDHREAA